MRSGSSSQSMKPAWSAGEKQARVTRTTSARTAYGARLGAEFRGLGGESFTRTLPLCHGAAGTSNFPGRAGRSGRPPSLTLKAASRITKDAMADPVPPAGGAVAAEDAAVAGAIRRYEERLAKDPTSLAFAPLADLYRKAGRTREAIRLCRDGLGRFPHYNTARLILAKALLDSGDPEGALAEVKAALEKSSRDAEAHRLAGEGHRRAGRLDQALGHLRQAVKLDPGDRESRALLEVLGGGGEAPEGSSLERLMADDTFATVSFGA